MSLSCTPFKTRKVGEHSTDLDLGMLGLTEVCSNIHLLGYPARYSGALLTLPVNLYLIYVTIPYFTVGMDLKRAQMGYDNGNPLGLEM
jgi:hypothetical protein